MNISYILYLSNTNKYKIIFFYFILLILYPTLLISYENKNTGEYYTQRVANKSKKNILKISFRDDVSQYQAKKIILKNKATIIKKLIKRNVYHIIPSSEITIKQAIKLFKSLTMVQQVELLMPERFAISNQLNFTN